VCLPEREYDVAVILAAGLVGLALWSEYEDAFSSTEREYEVAFLEVQCLGVPALRRGRDVVLPLRRVPFVDCERSARLYFA
jgi:hypothetical protein